MQKNVAQSYSKITVKTINSYYYSGYCGRELTVHGEKLTTNIILERVTEASLACRELIGHSCQQKSCRG